MNTFYRYWFLTLLIKFVIAAVLPFSSDEAYYWVWSNHLSLGYFDHPAMIAWLNKIGHIFDPFGLRWPAILVGHLSWIAWYEIFRDRLNLQLWVCLMLLNPLTGWGTFLAIPDTPATFFWAMSALSALRVFETKRMKWAAILGVSLGLGFNTKYHLALFAPALLIWLTWIKGWNRVRPTQVLIAIFLGLAASAPVLIWNFNNNFDSFFFQMGHGLASDSFRLVWPIEYLGSQIALLFPAIAFLCLRPPKNNSDKLLFVLGWFPILFFLGTSFRARPEGNWPILGYQPLITLAVLRQQWNKPLWATAALWGAAFILVMTEAIFQWAPIQDKDNLKTFESKRYDEFIPWLDSDIPVYASSFQMAATLNFKTRRPIYKLATLSRMDFYDYQPQAQPPKEGQFMVLSNRETDYSRTILKDYKFVEEKHFTPQKKIMIFEVPK